MSGVVPTDIHYETAKLFITPRKQAMLGKMTTGTSIVRRITHRPEYMRPYPPLKIPTFLETDKEILNTCMIVLGCESESMRLALQIIPAETGRAGSAIRTFVKDILMAPKGSKIPRRFLVRSPVAGVAGSPCSVIGHGTFIVKSADGKVAIPIEVCIAPSINVSLMPTTSFLTHGIRCLLRPISDSLRKRKKKHPAPNRRPTSGRPALPRPHDIQTLCQIVRSCKPSIDCLVTKALVLYRHSSKAESDQCPHSDAVALTMPNLPVTVGHPEQIPPVPLLLGILDVPRQTTDVVASASHPEPRPEISSTLPMTPHIRSL